MHVGFKTRNINNRHLMINDQFFNLRSAKLQQRPNNSKFKSMIIDLIIRKLLGLSYNNNMTSAILPWQNIGLLLKVSHSLVKFNCVIMIIKFLR